MMIKRLVDTAVREAYVSWKIRSPSLVKAKEGIGPWSGVGDVRLFLRLFFGDWGSRRNMVPNSVSS